MSSLPCRASLGQRKEKIPHLGEIWGPQACDRIPAGLRLEPVGAAAWVVALSTQ